MTDRLIDKIVDGVQLELPPKMKSVECEDDQWDYIIFTEDVDTFFYVDELLASSTQNYFRCAMVCEAVAYWTIIINKLKKITGSEWCDVYQQFHDAVAQRDAWLSLLEDE